MFFSQLANFLTFINERKVFELGIAFIISTQVNALATTFNTTIALPLIGYLINGQLTSLTKLKIQIGNSYILVGDFLTALVNFIMILFIIYLVFTQIESFRKTFPPEMLLNIKY